MRRKKRLTAVLLTLCLLAAGSRYVILPPAQSRPVKGLPHGLRPAASGSPVPVRLLPLDFRYGLFAKCNLQNSLSYSSSAAVPMYPGRPPLRFLSCLNKKGQRRFGTYPLFR